MFDAAVGVPGREDTLARLRLASERVVVGLAWAHGPVFLVLQQGTGTWGMLVILLWLALATAGTLARHVRPGTAQTRMTLAVTLCSMPALLVLLLEGHPWQIDAHMHFFAALAVVAVLLDYWAVLIGAGFIAVHHLLLNYVLAAFVFPGGSDLQRVLFHAVIVVFEAAALAWLVARAGGAMSAASAASAEMQHLTQARLLAERDARALADAAHRAAMKQTADAFEAKIAGFIGLLSTGAQELRATAGSMSSSAGQTGRQAAVVAGAAGRASSCVQAIAGALGQLVASMGEVGGQVARSARAADLAVADARRTHATVHALSEEVEKIGNVTQLIADIARRTNLLALNATIEAARAGEAGKGFAVVAAEVKNLAGQTARATGEISGQVAGIQATARDAAKAMHGIVGTIADVCSVAASIEAVVGKQGEATGEISRNVDETAAAYRDVTVNVAVVSQAANDTSAAAGKVLEAAGGMTERSEQLNGEVTRFLAGVRAA